MNGLQSPEPKKAAAPLRVAEGLKDWGDDTEPGAPLCRASCAQGQPDCCVLISWKHSSPVYFIPFWAQGTASPSPPCVLMGLSLLQVGSQIFLSLLSVGSIGRQLPHCQPARGEQSQQLRFSRLCSWAMPLEAMLIWCALSALLGQSAESCQICTA